MSIPVNHFPADMRKYKQRRISCIVCKRPGCYSKYRRHLLVHLSNGEINNEKFAKIIFKMRLPRRDLKANTSAKSQLGYMCHYRNESDVECMHIVLNLRRHLVSVHKLNRFSLKFRSIIAEAFKDRSLIRHSRVRSSHTTEMDDSMNLCNTTTSSTHLLNTSDTTSLYKARSNSYDVSSSSPEFSDPEYLTENEMEIEASLPLLTSDNTMPQLLYRNDALSLRFIDIEKVIPEFRSFLLTKGGGGRRNTLIKGDISSFRSMMKEFKWENFWDPNKLNHYVSSATCAPSTVYCRLRVYERFIHFLRIQMPSLLPTSDQMKAIDSMLCYLKEALGKDRHKRNMHTMAVSRERMPISFDVLRSWRSARATVEVKTHFLHFDKGTNNITEFLFRQLRNY